MTSFCATLRTLHVDKSTLQLRRRRNHFSQSSCGLRVRDAEPMQTSPGTPKRANTGAECPEVANSLAYTRVPSIRTIHIRVARFFFLALHLLSETGFIPQRFHSPPPSDLTDRRNVLLARIDCRRRKKKLPDCYDMQIVEIFRTCFGDFSSSRSVFRRSRYPRTSWTLLTLRIPKLY